MNGDKHKGDNSPADIRDLRHQMPRWVTMLLLAGIAVVIAGHIAHLLITLTVAALIAYILSSAVAALEAVGIKRSVAVVLLFVLGAVLIVLADIILAPYLRQEIRNGYARLPELSMQVKSALLSSVQKSPALDSGVRKLVDGIFGPTGFLEKTLNVPEILMQATPFIMGLVLVPFFVFFLLRDWPAILKKVMEWVPPSYVETTVSVIAEINILVGKYLRGLAADCLFIGVLASLGLWLIGVNYPIILGILSGVSNIVPYLGPVTACLVACLVALTQFNSFEPVLNVVLLYVSIRLMDDLLIQPMLIGKSVKLHPMLLVITIVAGEKLFGVIGMVLGVPVVTAAQKTAGILLEHRRETARRESEEKLLPRCVDKSPVRPI